MRVDVSAVTERLGAGWPYRASWVDRMQAALARGTIPIWAAYGFLWLAPLALVQALLWWNGVTLVGEISWVHVTLWSTAMMALALMHYLDRSAEGSLAAFRPAMIVSEEEYARLRYRMTNLPARGASWAAAVGLVIAMVEVSTFQSSAALRMNLFQSAATGGVELAMFAVGWVAWSTLVYHTIHQLRVVRHVYLHCTRLELFRLDPIYSFSWLTGRTAVGLALIPYLYLLGSVATLADAGAAELVRPEWLLVVLLNSVGAAVVFAVPLLGMHRLLVEEKSRLLREASTRLGDALRVLHERADAGDYAVMDGVNKLIGSLTAEQAVLERISTWPWKPDTPRWLASALLVPLALFVGQLALGAWLAP